MPTLAEARLSEQERRVVGRIVQALRDRLGDDLRSVWLYGSRARGEDTGPYSDVDLLAITAPGKGDSVDSVDVANAAAESEGLNPFAISLRVFDEEWLAGRRDIRAFFILDVDRDKIVLWGSG